MRGAQDDGAAVVSARSVTSVSDSLTHRLHDRQATARGTKRMAVAAIRDDPDGHRLSGIAPALKRARGMMPLVFGDVGAVAQGHYVAEGLQPAESVVDPARARSGGTCLGLLGPGPRASVQPPRDQPVGDRPIRFSSTSIREKPMPPGATASEQRDQDLNAKLPTAPNPVSGRYGPSR